MKLSDKKKEKISEQILAFLYSASPKAMFTSHVADEIVRDDEIVKSLLHGLEKKGLVVEIKKNQKGKAYSKRSRWALSDQAYRIYKAKQ
jgi:predicted transcriptional regulator with HTH domain